MKNIVVCENESNASTKYTCIEGTKILRAMQELEYAEVYAFNLGILTEIEIDTIKLELFKDYFFVDYSQIGVMLAKLTEQVNASKLCLTIPFDTRQVENLIGMTKFDWEDFNQNKQMEGQMSMFDVFDTPKPAIEQEIENIIEEAERRFPETLTKLEEEEGRVSEFEIKQSDIPILTETLDRIVEAVSQAEYAVSAEFEQQEQERAMAHELPLASEYDDLPVWVEPEQQNVVEADEIDREDLQAAADKFDQIVASQSTSETEIDETLLNGNQEPQEDVFVPVAISESFVDIAGNIKPEYAHIVYQNAGQYMSMPERQFRDIDAFHYVELYRSSYTNCKLYIEYLNKQQIKQNG